jgi:hypothetical protein
LIMQYVSSWSDKIITGMAGFRSNIRWCDADALVREWVWQTRVGGDDGSALLGK